MQYSIEILREPSPAEAALAEASGMANSRVILQSFVHSCENDSLALSRARLALGAIRGATGFRVYRLVAEFNGGTFIPLQGSK